jgi:hypothetical protein
LLVALLAALLAPLLAALLASFCLFAVHSLLAALRCLVLLAWPPLFALLVLLALLALLAVLLALHAPLALLVSLALLALCRKQPLHTLGRNTGKQRWEATLRKVIEIHREIALPGADALDFPWKYCYFAQHSEIP